MLKIKKETQIYFQNKRSLRKNVHVNQLEHKQIHAVLICSQ